MRYVRRLFGFCFFIGLFSPTAFASRPPRAEAWQRFGCVSRFEGHGWENYVDVLRATKLGPDQGRKASQNVFEAFVQVVASGAPQGLEEVSGPEIDEALEWFSLAAANYIRGLDVLTQIYWQEASDRLAAAEIIVPPIAFEQALRELEQNSSVHRALGVSGFVLQGAPAAEDIFLRLLKSEALPGLKALHWPAATKARPVLAGPVEAEAVRLLMQFAPTQPGDKVLQIAATTPAILLAHSILNSTREFGLFRGPLPERVNDILGPAQVQLIESDYLTRPGESAPPALKRGTFALVFALFTQAHSDVEFAAHLSAIHELLEEGGTFVLIADGLGGPIFSREQAQAAGLDVVRWDVQRHLSSEIRRWPPWQPRSTRSGELSVSVLRKGTLAAHKLWPVQNKR